MDLTLVRTRGPRSRAAALVLLCGLTATLVAGCGDSDAAPAAPPATASASASASASATAPPELPPAARKHTKAGAIAFVRHYIDLINYAQMTNDDRRVRKSSTKACGSCNAAARLMRQIRRTHGSITGGAWHVQSVLRVLPSGPNGELSIPMDIRYGPQTVRRGSNSTRYRGGSNIYTFFAEWRADHWVIDGMTRAK